MSLLIVVKRLRTSCPDLLIQTKQLAITPEGFELWDVNLSTSPKVKSLTELIIQNYISSVYKNWFSGYILFTV